MKPHEIIEELEGRGYDIEIQHFRRYSSSYEILPRGGETSAIIFDHNGFIVGDGYAYCHENDNYNKHIGIYIALGRALKQARIKV